MTFGLQKKSNETRNPIIIQSDRLDSHSIIDYTNTPGQWGKIWMLSGSYDNIINYNIIKNGKTGIHINSVNDLNNLPNNPNLIIKNSENIIIKMLIFMRLI